MKKQNGVTLIALVITIIVLLILAGVSIAMLTGENGILNQATKSVDQTLVSEAKEDASLQYNELVSEYYEAKYVSDTPPSESSVTEYVKAKFQANSYYTYSTGKITLTDKYNDGETSVGTITDNGITWGKS